MSKNKKIKPVQRRYKVLKLVCDYCGEERYYIIPCPHCGEPLSCKETLSLTADEIQELLAKGNDIEGLQHIKELADEDFSTDTSDDDLDTDLKGISPDEIDVMFDPDDWGL